MSASLLGLDWGSVYNKPDFDALYAPVGHTHADKANLDGGNTFTGNQVVTGNVTASGDMTLSTLNGSRLIFGSSGNTKLSATAGGLMLYDSPLAGGSASHYFREGGTAYLQIAGQSLEVQGTRSYTFSPTGASAGDIALYRSSATQLEINNRTAGTLRDLSLRTLTASGDTVAGSGSSFPITIGQNGSIGSYISFGNGVVTSGFAMPGANQLRPTSNGALSDNTLVLGHPSHRFNAINVVTVNATTVNATTHSGACVGTSGLWYACGSNGVAVASDKLFASSGTTNPQSAATVTLSRLNDTTWQMGTGGTANANANLNLANLTTTGTVTCGNGLIFDSARRIFANTTINYQSNANANTYQHSFTSEIGTGFTGSVMRIGISALGSGAGARFLEFTDGATVMGSIDKTGALTVAGNITTTNGTGAVQIRPNGLILAYDAVATANTLVNDFQSNTGAANIFIGTLNSHPGTGPRTGSNNTAVGGRYYAGAGYALTSGSENTLFGNGAGNTLTTQNANSFFGYLSGGTGANNVAIGYLAGFQGSGNSNIHIGDQSGRTAVESNKLRIGNGQTTPTIYGDLSGRRIVIGGTTDDGANTLQVNGNIALSGTSASTCAISFADRGQLLVAYGSGFGTQPIRCQANGGFALYGGNSTAAYWLGTGQDTSISWASAGVVQIGNGTTINALGSLNLSSITASGRVVTGAGANTFASTIFDNFTGVGIRPPATTSKGLHIKGLASQTGDLLLIADNAGTELVKVGATGGLTMAVNTALTMGGRGVLGVDGNGDCNFGSGVNSFIINKRMRMATGAAFEDYSGTNLIFRSGAAIVFQKMDGSGLASISGTTGVLSCPGVTSGGSTFTTAATTQVGVIAKGIASQTANLIEAQNSAGTALAAISSTGEIWSGASTSAYVGPNRVSWGAGASGGGSIQNGAITVGPISKFSFSSSNGMAAGDAAFSRITAGVVGLGNGTLADTSAELRLGTLVANNSIYINTDTRIQRTAAGDVTQSVYHAGTTTWQDAVRQQATASGVAIGFYGITPTARQSIPTNPTTAQIATALANLGLVLLV